MKSILSAAAAGLLLAAQALPASAQDDSDDASFRRAVRFADSQSVGSEGYRLSTSGGYQAMSGHVSDDAEYRRAVRFDGASAADNGAYRLSTSGSQMAARHIDDDAEARRAARFN